MLIWVKKNLLETQGLKKAMNDVGTEAGRGEGLRDRERREGGGECTQYAHIETYSNKRNFSSYHQWGFPNLF